MFTTKLKVSTCCFYYILKLALLVRAKAIFLNTHVNVIRLPKICKYISKIYFLFKYVLNKYAYIVYTLFLIEYLLDM